MPRLVIDFERAGARDVAAIPSIMGAALQLLLQHPGAPALEGDAAAISAAFSRGLMFELGTAALGPGAPGAVPPGVIDTPAAGPDVVRAMIEGRPEMVREGREAGGDVNRRFEEGAAPWNLLFPRARLLLIRDGLIQVARGVTPAGSDPCHDCPHRGLGHAAGDEGASAGGLDPSARPTRGGATAGVREDQGSAARDPPRARDHRGPTRCRFGHVEARGRGSRCGSGRPVGRYRQCRTGHRTDRGRGRSEHRI